LHVMSSGRPRLVVVSPFLDKRHGTERRVVEWISRLSDDFEIHVYSQRVEDLDLSSVTWHRIPRLPGPHLVSFLWWFAANHIWRWFDRRFRGLLPDLIFTPGTNCLDADAVSVHIVFAEFRRQVESELSLWRNPVWFWPRLLHRRLYYRLIIFLERHIYPRPGVQLILIARKTARDLRTHYGCTGFLPVVYIGLDQYTFNPEMRQRLRAEARRELGLKDNEFVLLLVGNDWKKKGLLTLLGAIGSLRDLPLRLLVAGQDDASPYQGAIQKAGIQDRVTFAPSRKDVIFYYGAADAYVGPSLEDTFAQPPAEAMACGLGVITSITNGTAEIITNGVDGIIIQDPNDAAELAAQIRRIQQDPAFLRRLGENAARTARQYTWERNGKQMKEILENLLRRKKGATTALSS
jgi:glycosyltransferase involved in cell wall biosynthesis